jgi:hypothetical protein
MGVSGKITKMRIEGYTDPKYKTKYGVFEFQVNPEHYSLSVETAVKPLEKLANSNIVMVSGVPEYKELNVSFILDSTGVIPGCDDVSQRIEDFNELCLDIAGDIHVPYYLKVIWGDINFPCRLSRLDIDYKMFNSSGLPIRAELKAGFKEFIDPETKEKIKGNSSPDMSHLKIVVAGDTLPMLCNDVYGDSKYYIQVAEINGLLNFRHLIPGQKLIFPRMQK